MMSNPYSVALTDEEREEFRKLPKRIAASARPRWRERNPGSQVYVAHLGLVDDLDIQVGEVVLVWSCTRDVPAWKFKLKRLRNEVVRWEFDRGRGDVRGHSNPSNRPEGWPRKDRSIDHEHMDFDRCRRSCSRPIPGPQGLDHRASYDLFCNAFAITAENGYPEPPACQSEMRF